VRSRAPAALVFAAVAIAARTALAGGLEFDVPGARAIGRAGAVAVSADGGAALLVNPGGMARRTALRLQIGTAIHDDAASFEAADSAATGSPVVEDLGQPVSAPFVAAQGSVGPVVLGATYLECGDLARTLPVPERNQLPEDVSRLYPHRYGGTALGFHRRLIAIGAAVRAASWLGVGVALNASDVGLREQRHAWAGLEIRADDTVGDPLRDLRLEVDGRDWFVPGASVGVLIAPPQLPMELALAASGSTNARLDGSAALEKTRTDEYPEPIITGTAASSASLAMPLTARAGLRYLGDRVLVEADGELTFFRGAGASPTWELDGIGARRVPGVEATLAEAPSLVDQRNHATARLAVDVEVARGFLWLSAGYAVRAAGAHREAVSPAYADLGGHTLALGAEGQWRGTTLTIGYAHTFARTLNETGSHLLLVNPFDAGTMVVGNGRYRRVHDAFGIAIEVAWE